MHSVEEINGLQATIAAKNKNIKDLQNEIKAMSVELENFHLSENEAIEIIAELNEDNKKIKEHSGRMVGW